MILLFLLLLFRPFEVVTHSKVPGPVSRMRTYCQHRAQRVSTESDDAVKAMVVRNSKAASHSGVPEEKGAFGNPAELQGLIWHCLPIKPKFFFFFLNNIGIV